MGNRITKTDRRVRINHKAGQRRHGPVQFGLGVLCLLLMSSSVRADETTWTFTGYEDTYTTIASSGLVDVFTASARAPTGQRIAVGFTKNDPFFLGGFTANENFNFGVVRYDLDGSLDPSFTPSCAPLFINCT
ncbi:MAG: delta-60 repeat domain-containing protein, partial [Candidatus Binatia bacterium]|nr:delta-60 repeat domain-containing protein [Candidatus Binatia bacterium]